MNLPPLPTFNYGRDIFQSREPALWYICACAMWLMLGWLLIFLLTSAAMGLLNVQIVDDIERDIPIDARPSWRLLKVRRFPWEDLRLHRRMYPSSHVRKWWTAAVICQLACLVVPFVYAIVHSFRN